MTLSWALAREIFFYAGSIAGVLALFRPVLESKFRKDQERAEAIKRILPEQDVIDLDSHVYQRRLIYTKEFEPFSQLLSDLRNNTDSVRFSGPCKRYYRAELVRMTEAYTQLRNYVQVPWWKPAKDSNGDVDEFYWVFDKSSFFKSGAERSDYAKHLEESGACAERIKIAFQRFQIVSDMHLLEAPFAFFLLPRRFKANGLQL